MNKISCEKYRFIKSLMKENKKIDREVVDKLTKDYSENWSNHWALKYLVKAKNSDNFEKDILWFFEKMSEKYDCIL